DVCFITFNNAAQKFTVSIILNRLADAVAKIPSGLVGHAQVPLELQSRDTLFRFTDKIDRDEPLAERQMRVMEYCPGGYAKVIAAWITLKLIALVVARNLFRVA